jgi:hypothetical protein
MAQECQTDCLSEFVVARASYPDIHLSYSCPGPPYYLFVLFCNPIHLIKLITRCAGALARASHFLKSYFLCAVLQPLRARHFQKSDFSHAVLQPWWPRHFHKSCCFVALQRFVDQDAYPMISLSECVVAWDA